MTDIAKKIEEFHKFRRFYFRGKHIVVCIIKALEEV